MKRFRMVGVSLAVAALSVPALAQAQGRGEATGVVTAAENGAPLSGAQVRIQGTTRQTVTDGNGRYRITSIEPGSYTLNVSILGRAAGTRAISLTAGQTVTANFSLASSAIALEGVVVNAVTGQAERRREVGTNVANIAVAELNKGPVRNVADVLTARTAGVTLQGVTGSTGTAQRIRIRGANSLSLNNEPLIYIDGVQMSNATGGIGAGGQEFSRLNDINSNDIENIEVLKGPAASALYGTAAANGVLLITTRRGRSGAAVWRAYAEAGTLSDENQYPATYTAFQVNRARPDSFFESRGRLRSNAANNDNVVRFCPNFNATTGTNVSAAAGTCRQDESRVFNSFENSSTRPFTTGNRSRYGLNVSGGTASTTYYLSAEREDERGVIEFNTLDKNNVRANLNAVLSDKLTLAVNTGYTDSHVVLNSGDNSVFSPLINGLLFTAVLPDSVNTAGLAGARRGYGFGNSLDDIGADLINQEVDRFIIGTNATYRPFSWLQTNANVGLDTYTRFDSETVQPGDVPILDPDLATGYRDSYRLSNYIYTGNASGVASFDISNDIASTTTIGTSYQRSMFRGTECFGFAITPGTASCKATANLKGTDENFSEVITVGAFAQQQFAWRDRLFLAASIRGDDNSAFGADFGFITYPSGSLSWVVSEEPFFPQSSFLSNLRLRTAIGTSGLRPEFRDASDLFEPVTVADANLGDVPGITQSVTGNLDLKPERTTEVEFGFDAGLFRDRLSLDYTYFNKRSKDALINRSTASSQGITETRYENLGSVRNWGSELGLNALVLDRRNTRLNMRVSATVLDNKVEELGEGVEPITIGRGEQRHQEGYPTGAYFQPAYTFADTDNDGFIDVSEVKIDSSSFVVGENADGSPRIFPTTYLGRILPSNTQSLSGELTLFGAVTFSTLFERRGGFKQLNATEQFRCNSGFARQTRGNCAAVADPNASLEDQARFVASRFYGTNAGYVEDADFVKWREASVRFGVPESLGRGLRALRGASVTLSGRNLKTWTDYSGIDPEINETGGNTNFNQGEFNTQPPVRYFTVRLDLSL